MKKLLLFFILNIFLPLSLYSQNKQEEWDEQTSIYKNFKYDFSWVLNRDFTWVKQPLVQKDAVFGAVNLELRIVAYVVVRDANVGSDIWQNFENEKRNTLNSIKQSQMNVELIEFSKCRFAGKNAILMRTINNYKNDSREPMQVIYSSTSYLVYNNNKIYTISIFMDKILEDCFNEEGVLIKDSFFNGWLFNAE